MGWLLRLGHSRPAGSEWRTRMYECDPRDPPQLDDLISERPDVLARGYRVVGVEETSDPTTYVLVLERLRWGDWQDEVASAVEPRVWTFVRRKR